MTQPKILVYDRYNAAFLADVVGVFGYPPCHVSTMQELLAELKSSRFDLLIVEICDVDCQQIADALRQIPNCEVLFTTCGEEGHGYPLPTGDEFIIEKPIELDRLGQMLRQLLGQPVQ